MAARRLAQALAWADVFVLSGLDPDLVDDLSLVALENPGAGPPPGRPGAARVRSSATPS